MPMRAMSLARSPVISRPSSVIEPALARTSPEIVFSVVVLPAPLAPSSVTIWPRLTSRSMPLRARMRP